MSGWLRHLELNAQARIGFGLQLIIWTVIAVVASIAAMIFLVFAAFIWLATRYDTLVADLVLGGAFALITLIAIVASRVARNRNMERARRELAARSRTTSRIDPTLMAVAFQIGQAIGWRKVVSLAAIGLIAAGLAKEWLGASKAPVANDGEPRSDY
jgi:hypothetical protein